jgi:SAM-dependent methyltransferase
MALSLSDAWRENASRWIAWARTPGHDSYWRFHRRRFLDLVPGPGRLTVDVGCGEGRVGRDLTARGHTVVGIDASAALAQACASHAHGHPAAVGDAAQLPVRDDVADLVVAFMSLHDVDDLQGAVTEAARILRAGGRFHVAIVHPINSAGTFTEQPDDIEAPFVITGSYTDTFRYADDIERDGLTMTFHSYHRPLTSYARALRNAGFVIETLEEVTDDDPADRWSRVPLFLHLIASR